ncbi:MAG TPA: transcriptional regulator [Micromonosporaceae bacterium]|nr:transcriptional regulator [Micromonosporaceae bacterium]HCU50170.1 transcriptional regulator [Micromonosporaceae bacterium]
MPARSHDAVPNIALYNLRDARAETQEQLAEALNALARKRGEVAAVTGNHVSRWERGIVHPSRLHCQLLAEHFGVTVGELGLTRQKVAPVGHRGNLADSVANVLRIEDPATTPDGEPPVIESQQQWLHVRRSMHANHTRLAQNAARLYPEEVRVGASGILARPEWTFASPVDLENIQISFDPDAKAPAFDGTEDLTSHVRPLQTIERRYQRYSQAIRDVAQPKLFENRLSWRLAQADFTDSGARLSFGNMNYFDAMDTCEAVAHEFAQAHLVNDGEVSAPTWRGLRFRKAIDDPFDLSRRPLLMSINTLTIRRDKNSASVVLHNRNAANVATSGGVIGVMPAGVFQPSSVRSGDHSGDFDLWRNIMREYSEEFLGNPEHDGDGAGADYDAEPLRSLDLARRSGGVRIYCFGLGIGALDLWGGLETVAVFDAEVFDELFANLVRVNDEGTILRVGTIQPTAHIPFTSEVVKELLATERLAPETAMSLQSAWRHRDQLL